MVLSQLKKKYGIAESSKTTENEQNTNQKTSTLEELKNKYAVKSSAENVVRVPEQSVPVPTSTVQKPSFSVQAINKFEQDKYINDNAPLPGMDGYEEYYSSMVKNDMGVGAGMGYMSGATAKPSKNIVESEKQRVRDNLDKSFKIQYNGENRDISYGKYLATFHPEKLKEYAPGKEYATMWEDEDIITRIHSELENAGARSYLEAYNLLTKSGYDSKIADNIAYKYYPKSNVGDNYAFTKHAVEQVLHPATAIPLDTEFGQGNDAAYNSILSNLKNKRISYWEAELIARELGIYNPDGFSESGRTATFDEYKPVYDVLSEGKLSDEDKDSIVSELRAQNPDDYRWQTVFGESDFANVGKTDYHTWDVYKNLPDTVGDFTGPHALSKEKIAQWEKEGYSPEDIAESLILFSLDPGETNNIYNDMAVNKHLTLEERMEFARIWDEQGRDAAEKYLDSLRETAAYREGAERREEIGDNILNELWFDLRYGIKESLKGFEKAGSATKEKATSPDAYTSSIIFEDAADSGFEVFGKSLEQWLHRGATTVGGMLPGIVMGAAGGAIGGPVVGTISRAVTIFGSAQGNGMQTALNNGASYEEAQIYSFATGLAEATSDTLLSSVGKAGGSVFSKLTGNAAEKAGKAIFKASPKLAKVLKWGGAYGGKIVGEVVEEYSQYLLDPALQNLIYDAGNEIEPFSEEALETVMLAAMISATFDGFGVGTYLDVIRKPAKVANALLEQTDGIKALEETRNVFKEKVDNGTVTLDDIADFAGKSTGYAKLPVHEDTSSIAIQKADAEKKTEDDGFYATFEETFEDLEDASENESEAEHIRDTLSDDAKGAFDIAMATANDKKMAADEFNIKYLEGKTGAEFTVAEDSELTPSMQKAAYDFGVKAAKVEAEKGYRAIASSYGEAGKAAYEAIISGSRSVSASNFMEMHNAYTAGLSGIDMPKAKTLSDAELRTLYQAGQKDAKASLKAEKGAVGSRVIRKDAGLTQDAYTATMDKVTVSQVDRVLKALGLKGTFVDSVKGGQANAEIRNDGTILLAKDMENPVRTVIGHEITHRMQELAPKEYRAFRDAVMKELGESRDGRIVSTLLRYKQAGVDLNSEAAMDEIAADYAGMLMEDGKLLDEFIEKHKENKSLLRKFLDAVRAIIAKLTGADKARLQTIESKLMKALEASAKVADKATKTDGEITNTAEGGARWSVKTKRFTKNSNIDESGKVKYNSSIKWVYDAGLFDGEQSRKFYAAVADIQKRGHKFYQKARNGDKIIEVDNMLVYFYGGYANPKISQIVRINSDYETDIAAVREDIYDFEKGKSSYNQTMRFLEEVFGEGIIDFYEAETFSSSQRQTGQAERSNSGETYQNSGNLKDGRGNDSESGEVDNLATEADFDESAFSMPADNAKTPTANEIGIEVDTETDSVAPSGRFSLKTWNESDYVTARNTAAKEIAEAIGVSQRKARDHIDSVNSIAKLIADDIDRLDYTASDGVSVFVSNAEYGGSIDMSTLCPKRAIMSGTFSAIQKALPNTALTATEILEIRKKMADKGLEVSCGCCYVEGSRAAMGGFAKEFINLYSKYYPSRWIPNMVDVNTPDGVERMRIEHPEAYEQYEYFWNHYGTLREGDKKLFASQQKPKLFQARTAYNGDILKHFSKESSVTEKNKNGGLRIQSFSDFEIVHLIDMMQVIMDMSRVGLAGQAYTKVPDFAWALGDTGLKINLSLISKGLDENGNLVFDPREGMSIEDAMELRERYSQNVGTILVVFSDAELKAAMSDDRVDFIIPFHRSQWKKSQYATLGLPAYTKDYTNQQNEKLIKKTYHEYRGRMVPDKAKNFVPSDYWDYNKSGKENAEAYLTLCAKNNKRPKFYKLLVDNGNGTYSLQPDGSTDGYWKLLIDYKMYDNDGIGSPQKPVRPIFNMQESERMLNEYKGGHSQFPVAYDIVDEFVEQYKAEHPNAKYSLKGKDMYQTEYEAVMREAREQGLSTEEVEARIRGVNEKVLNALVKEYGAIKPGERPSRAVTLPKKTSEGKKVSHTVRTVMEAEATPDEMLPTIEQMVAEGEFSYETITDKEAMAKAEDRITKNGFDATVREWFKSVGSGKVSKDNTALGWTIYNNAANSGNTELAIEVLCEMVKHQRNAAQALQATRILKKLSPSGQLYAAQKSVQGLQEELEERYGNKAPELKIDPKLAEEVLNADTEEKREKALANLYRDIGRQMPSSVMDKWNAWRYLSMLGNARTHIRNIVGNAGFAPVVAAKNITATGIESLVSFASRGKIGRTKAFVGVGKTDRALLAAAWTDYDAVADAALGQSKYNDNQFANKHIEEGKRVFKFKPLEAARRGNSWLLDKEDFWFSKPQYANALAQYCKANGITAEQIKSGKGLEKARAYAIKEAQKATYRDTNAFSELFSKLGKIDERGEFKTAKRIWNRGVEGVLPFRKTPANILARGIEYSPIGLGVGVKNLLLDVKSGKVTAAEAIDKMSAGLTGSGLMALGAFLVTQGVLRGFGGDDDKEKEYMELMGHQQYALEIGNTSVTLDWLAPEALPFFVGANIAEQAMQDGEMTVEGLISALGSISDPMLSMSCLQGLNDLIESVSFSDTSGIVTIAASAATSYLTQGIPTLFGQIERTSEAERMMTYTSKSNKMLTPDMQYTVGKVSAKLPGDYSQIPYIDAWGRTEPSGSVGERAFNNMLNPSYTSTVSESPMEKELLRLYNQTGESVLPSRADKSFQIDGEQVYLNAEQYQKYATSRGKRSYRILTSLTKSEVYNSLDDFTKAEIVAKVYTYCNAIAKSACGAKNNAGKGYALDGWVSKAYDACSKYGIDEATYIAAYIMAGNAGKYADDEGTIDGSNGLCKMAAIYDTYPNLTKEQYTAMFSNFGIGKTVIGYTPKKVNSTLAEYDAKYKYIDGGEQERNELTPSE